MEYRLNEGPTSVTIEVTAGPDEQAPMLEEFARCAEGTCSCPSRQYEKLASLQVRPHDTGVRIELVPRPGEVLDRADLENCLRVTAEKVRH